MYERAQAEASKREREHRDQKNPFDYVRGCEKTGMNEQSACQRERSRHGLSCPAGPRGRSKAKGGGSLAEDPIVHGVEGIQFWEQSAPPQNRTEGIKHSRGLQEDSGHEPREDDPWLEVQGGVLARADRRGRFLKSLLKNKVTFNIVAHRSYVQTHVTGIPKNILPAGFMREFQTCRRQTAR
jgi:hypothetical protein